MQKTKYKFLTSDVDIKISMLTFLWHIFVGPGHHGLQDEEGEHLPRPHPQEREGQRALRHRLLIQARVKNQKKRREGHIGLPSTFTFYKSFFASGVAFTL